MQGYEIPGSYSDRRIQPMSFADAKPDADNTIVIGNYRIKAQMDTSQEARLEIENKTSGEYLLYGPANGAVKAKGRKFSHSTLLINKTSGCQGRQSTVTL